MTIRRIGSVLAGAALVLLGLTVGPAVATHDVPATAGHLHFSLVPNFRQTISGTQCTARGGAPSTHGTPLALPSCNPPAFAPGTQAHGGSQSVGSADITVVPGDTDPTNGDQADILLSGSGTDLRAGSKTGPDYNPAAAGTDMNSVGKVRISDHYNHTTGQPCTSTTSCPGTVQDLDFGVGVACAPTADPSVGSNCSVSTSADMTIPNIVLENKHAIVQAFRIRLKDAGANGTPGDTDDKDAFMQGIYIP
jgi:hypothetical protein